MSLIKVRQRRKKSWIDARRGMSIGKLAAFLLLVLAMMWYLGRF